MQLSELHGFLRQFKVMAARWLPGGVAGLGRSLPAGNCSGPVGNKRERSRPEPGEKVWGCEPGAPWAAAGLALPPER
ncbi:hypothetical protein CF134_15775 [Aeromonas salmonicida]|uniref:Uncharacterized protein n=1 Tax=Aeromonas salmonicida subsp. pectinolytica 34mel TaxID=1324960 RepID=A0A2D1QIN5_AERSA|nr:uncharacterized protein Asalp_31130 [Aeromonas salmonicida subsp. pectinolytica 34mel]TNI14307.1 hypothetical protein CF134_15775 [Aeromonas salmonicida]